MNINNEESNNHIHRCVDVIKNDKDISHNTLIIMFLQYKEILLTEYKINEKI